VLAPRCSARR